MKPDKRDIVNRNKKTLNQWQWMNFFSYMKSYNKNPYGIQFSSWKPVKWLFFCCSFSLINHFFLQSQFLVYARTESSSNLNIFFAKFQFTLLTQSRLLSLHQIRLREIQCSPPNKKKTEMQTDLFLFLCFVVNLKIPLWFILFSLSRLWNTCGILCS